MSTPEKDPRSVNGFWDWLADIWARFNVFTELNADDPFYLTAGKIGVRLLGILVALILSPFLLFGLFIAFIAVT